MLNGFGVLIRQKLFSFSSSSVCVILCPPISAGTISTLPFPSRWVEGELARLTSGPGNPSKLV